MEILIKVKKFLGLTNDIKEYRKKGMEIGKNCKILNSRIDMGHAYLIKIGDNCTLTNCTILAHDATTKIWFGKTRVGIVEIGDNTFIGFGAIILPNVKIGKNCIIGAGCVVTQNIPDNSVCVGNPCKIISTIDEFKAKHSEFLKEKPVFNTYWKYKSDSQKMEEKNILKNTFGYDE